MKIWWGGFVYFECPYEFGYYQTKLLHKIFCKINKHRPILSKAIDDKADIPVFQNYCIYCDKPIGEKYVSEQLMDIRKKIKELYPSLLTPQTGE